MARWFACVDWEDPDLPWYPTIRTVGAGGRGYSTLDEPFRSRNDCLEFIRRFLGEPDLEASTTDEEIQRHREREARATSQGVGIWLPTPD